ncbi:MAG TPA: c-type cytochrome domain-containing protein, partial [Armatimonadota bacterium]|nr:c-type cytochrome domain-containing protein [Armatimonadota bacterium]
MSGTVHRLLTSLRPARMAPLWVAAVGSLAWVAALPAAPAPPPARPMVSRPADTTTFFESRVRPVLAEKCFTCHGPRLQQGGLRLDSRQGLLKGGAQGPALAPTASERSLLLRAVRHAEPGLQMPPGEKLRDDQIADLERWVRMGAPWPVERMKAEGGRMKGAAAATSLQPDAQHWAFRPVKRPALPPVKGRNWVKTPIDAFILADLEKRNLAPAPPADRRTLLRRATFDLTGLPP